jgi:hypothetical protein
MINGEDYNIFPQTLFTNIQKIKAVNRTSSGVSLYLDAIDPTGSYSSTNVFGDDGTISSNVFVGSTTFSFTTTNDIYDNIYNKVLPIIDSVKLKNYYYATYKVYNSIYSDITFQQTANVTSSSSGYLKRSGLLTGTANNTSYITGITNLSTLNLSAGLSIAGNGIPSNTTITQVVTATNTIKLSANSSLNTSANLRYTGNTLQVGSGVSGNLKYVASGASLQFTAPTGYYFDAQHNLVSGSPSANGDSTSFFASVTDTVSNGDITTPSLVTFGTVVPNLAILSDSLLLGANAIVAPYKTTLSSSLINTIINQITTKVTFGLTYDQVNQTWVNTLPSDLGNYATWAADTTKLIRFDYTQGNYTISYKTLDYLFSSAKQTKFYFDPTVRVYNSTTGTNINDTIKILKINTKPDSANSLESDILWQIYDVITGGDGYVEDSRVVVKSPTSQLLGVPDYPNLYKIVAGTSSSRSDLYFQYKHNVPSRNRIDPTPVNIIDMYVLTNAYSSSYLSYLRDVTGTITEPYVPTVDSLVTTFGELENYKAVSDTIVYNPAKFKPLFGSKAATNLQATFQVVKNPNVGLTDNEIKLQVVQALNEYFDPKNWEFGDTFYFTELAAYLHTILVPNISSILIVPKDQSLVFGNYFQINAEPWEIITSAATVNDVNVVTSVTAATLNLGNTLYGS